MEELKSAVVQAWNRLVEKAKELVNAVVGLCSTKERPKQVASMHDYIEKKKRSEPFYKASQKNRKPWE